MKGRRNRQVMDAEEMSRAVKRIAYEILERNKGARGLVLVGVPTPGPLLAARIADHIRKVEGVEVATGSLDITFYRDDIHSRPSPTPKGTDLEVSLEGKTVVLVDDVLYTGRTIRAALDALLDHGRPDKVQLAVLLDRGHRELPVRADYVGRNIPTSREETVEVQLRERGGEDRVLIREGGEDD